MPPADAHLRLRDAVVLGLLHGPAELLPVSSSGHVTLLPWLLGWSYPELDAELRKSFEIALHAGTAAALIVALRDEVAEAAADLDRRRIELVVLSFLPPAALALTLERRIEQRLGTPATIAGGLVAGSLALIVSDRYGRSDRHRDESGALDALILGLAQATALVPGVSRNGATLAAGRARGFHRADANVLSRHVALPLILGASALKATRLYQRGMRPGTARAFAAGTAAAFASTLLSAGIIKRVERGQSPLPYALYRLGLAAVVVRRLRQDESHSR